MLVSRSKIAALILFLTILPVIGLPLGTGLVRSANASPPYISDIVTAISNGEEYLSKITRTTYYPNLQPKDRIIAEYPSVPIWGRYGDVKFVPGLQYKESCSSLYSMHTEVSLEMTGNWFDNDYTIWDYRITFYYVVSSGLTDTKTPVAKLVVSEHQYIDHMVVSVYAEDYSTAQGKGCVPGLDGRNIQVYLGPYFLGTVGELYMNSAAKYINTPLPSMRYSLRHVEAMADAYYKMAGKTDGLLDSSLRSMFNAVFQSQQTPYDLYANAILDYITGFTRAPFSSMAFYDAHWFGTYPANELGYTRLWDWATSRGYPFATASGLSYPLYPYKSKVVSAAEETNGLTDGGTLFLLALEHPPCPDSTESDPLYYGWQGIYYASTGQWSSALSDWNKILGAWDGDGLKVCYSEHYSTVRLAVAVILGTLLASHGYTGWFEVDAMVHTLLKLQWRGDGWYLDGNNVWRHIYKFDHKGGFIVAYDIAPDMESYGSTGFRPGIADALTQGTAMPSEYAGVIPTNAETTLAALIALQLYLNLRY